MPRGKKKVKVEKETNKLDEPVYEGKHHGAISVGSVKASVYSSKEEDGSIKIVALYHRGEVAHEDSILIREDTAIVGVNNLMSAAIYKVLSDAI